jgi:hypothetical protein
MTEEDRNATKEIVATAERLAGLEESVVTLETRQRQPH